MSEKKSKCAIAWKISTNIVPNECQTVEEFAYYLGTTLFGLTPQEIPNKQTCRLILLRSLIKRDYKKILQYVLCVLMSELEQGKTFQEAIRKAWEKTKEKIGE